MKIQVKVVKIIAGVWLIYYYQSLFRNKTFMFHEMTQRFKIINVFGIWKRMGYFHFVLLEYVNRNKAFYFGEKVLKHFKHIPLISEEWKNILAVARGREVVRGGPGGPWPPQYFALPRLEGPFMGKKASLGKKFEDLLGEKASPAKKIKDFQRKKTSLRKNFFWPPQSQNPTSLPAMLS